MYLEYLRRITEGQNESTNESLNRKIHKGNLEDEINKHSKSYSDLLDLYVKSVRWNIRIKSACKVLFFICIMGALATVLCLFHKSLIYVFNNIKGVGIQNISIEAIVSMATVLIPSISSLIVAFIKLPEIIAKYLFNSDEDNYMNIIIKNIQDYDSGIYDREYKIKELINDNKKSNKGSKDTDIPDAPNMKNETQPNKNTG